MTVSTTFWSQNFLIYGPIWIEFQTVHLLHTELCNSFSRAGSFVTNPLRSFRPRRPSCRLSREQPLSGAGGVHRAAPPASSHRGCDVSPPASFIHPRNPASRFLSWGKWALVFGLLQQLFILLLESLWLFPGPPESLDYSTWGRRGVLPTEGGPWPGPWGEDCNSRSLVFTVK